MLRLHDQRPFWREETRLKLLGKRGPDTNRWDASKTEEERDTDRGYPEYKAWRTAVYGRDNFTCRCCGRSKSVSGRLIAHHLNSYAKHPSLRTVLNNGVTLCVDCHEDFHRLYTKRNSTEDQFREYLRFRSEVIHDEERLLSPLRSVV